METARLQTCRYRIGSENGGGPSRDVEVRNSIQPNTQRHNAIRRDSELTVFVHSSLVESRCPCRDVGEAILVGSLRPIRTARETLGGRTLERPSCGGFMPTAETTLFPAYSARSRRLLTSSARLDNEPNFRRGTPGRLHTAGERCRKQARTVQASHTVQAEATPCISGSS